MAKRPTREQYRGNAVIMGIGLERAADWREWETRDLSEADKATAFKIVYDVAEGDAHGARHEIKVEVSHRELRGVMLDYYRREDGIAPTQIDVAIRTLRTQGLIGRDAKTEMDLAPALNDSLCGAFVNIRAYEEQDDSGRWWPRAVFASKYQRVTGAEKNDLLAAFASGKAYTPPTATPAANTNAIPAPSLETDPDALPF